MKKTKIIIVDSGISPDAKCASNVSESYKLVENNAVLSIENAELNDFVGHGTAVANIIYSCNEAIDLISFRVCDSEMEINDSGLIAVLKYINENIQASIINISLGCTYVYHYDELEKICSSLKNKGFVIVAAFDNEGAVSYPSALDSVIGIDVTKSYAKNSSEKINAYIYQNSIVDVVLPNVFYRTQWLDKKTILKGTSFACAKITGLLSLKIETAQLPTKKLDILNLLENDYTLMYKSPFYEAKISSPSFTVKKAIIFPVNKESHALLRYKQMLKFDLVGVYDERLSGNVGRIIFNEEIKSIDKLDWNDDFDTIILSCFSDLSMLTNRDYAKQIMDNAIRHNKNVYSFEEIASDYSHLFCPMVVKSNIPYSNRWKMRKISVPVVCVMGTSPKQGKFTLQLDIVNRLSNIGYSTGFIASEPSGYLFGADAVFHFGHRSSLSLHPQETAALLNEMSWHAQIKGRDIIISGSQSGTIHYNNSTIECFSIDQYGFLLGMMADYYILCINPHDELEYVEKTINFVNSIDEGKVMALVVYPIKAIETLSGIKYKNEALLEKDLYRLKNSYNEFFELPAYVLGNEDDMESLAKQIIDWFSE